MARRLLCCVVPPLPALPSIRRRRKQPADDDDNFTSLDKQQQQQPGAGSNLSPTSVRERHQQQYGSDMQGSGMQGASIYSSLPASEPYGSMQVSGMQPDGGMHHQQQARNTNMQNGMDDTRQNGMHDDMPIQRPATKTARWAMTGNDLDASPTRSSRSPSNVVEDEVETFEGQPQSPSPRGGQHPLMQTLPSGQNRWESGSKPPPLPPMQNRWDPAPKPQMVSPAQPQSAMGSRLQNVTTAARLNDDGSGTKPGAHDSHTRWTPESKAPPQPQPSFGEDSPVVVRANSDLSDLSDPDEYQKYGAEDDEEGEGGDRSSLGGGAGRGMGADDERPRQDEEDEEEERLRSAALAAVQAQYGGAVPSGGAGMPLAVAAAAAMAARQNAAAGGASAHSHQAPSAWSSGPGYPGPASHQQHQMPAKPQQLDISKALHEDDDDAGSTDWTRPGPGHYDGDEDASPAVQAGGYGGPRQQAAAYGAGDRPSQQRGGLYQERSSAGRSSTSTAARQSAVARNGPKMPADTPIDSPHPQGVEMIDDDSQWDSDSDGPSPGRDDASSTRPSGAAMEARARSAQQEPSTAAAAALAAAAAAVEKMSVTPNADSVVHHQASSTPAIAIPPSAASTAAARHMVDVEHEDPRATGPGSEERSSRNSIESGRGRTSSASAASGRAVGASARTADSQIPRYLQATAASGARTSGRGARTSLDDDEHAHSQAGSIVTGSARKGPSDSGHVTGRASNGSTSGRIPAASAAAKSTTAVKGAAAAKAVDHHPPTKIPSGSTAKPAPKASLPEPAAPAKAAPLSVKPTAVAVVSTVSEGATRTKAGPKAVEDPPVDKPAVATITAPEPALESRNSVAQSATSEATSGASARVPVNMGIWKLVRLKKAMACDACTGTVEQETVDGDKEVFQCDVVMQPGALAVVIAHEIAEGEGAARVPRTWCFCPDTLCMDSKPKGSSLPPWPPKLPLEPGMKITRSEYNQLLELGLDVQAPAKKAAPAPADGGAN